MPRHNKKATNIAFAILGIPSNMQKPKKKQSIKESPVKTDMTYEEYARLNQSELENIQGMTPAKKMPIANRIKKHS